jgi:hypothetical protein
MLSNVHERTIREWQTGEACGVIISCATGAC